MQTVRRTQPSLEAPTALTTVLLALPRAAHSLVDSGDVAGFVWAGLTPFSRSCGDGGLYSRSLSEVVFLSFGSEPATSVGAVSGIILRRAGVDDIGGVAQSSAALFAEDGAARDPLRNRNWPAQHGEQWCAGLLNDRNALVLVAAAGEDVVGHLVGSFGKASAMWIGPRAELVSMHVNAAHRGRGVGSRLVEDFRQWAQQRGAVRLQVTAYIANEGAIRFYARHGFTVTSVELAAPP